MDGQPLRVTPVIARVRSDSHPSAVTAQDFERKRQACLNAGQGVNQTLLYRCMATAVYFTE